MQRERASQARQVAAKNAIPSPDEIDEDVDIRRNKRARQEIAAIINDRVAHSILADKARKQMIQDITKLQELRQAKLKSSLHFQALLCK